MLGKKDPQERAQSIPHVGHEKIDQTQRLEGPQSSGMRYRICIHVVMKKEWKMVTSIEQQCDIVN
ncbi:hypothetical protein N172_08045 [Pantoea dispersa EGD-AAK13]|nr:hypothetical protein N172_08045 [Pantoea dispersa EGD-AAK13]